MALAADAKARVRIYGSPRVIKCLCDFEAVGASFATPESATVIVTLLVEMRKDTGISNSDIGHTQLQDILLGTDFVAQLRGNKTKT